MERLRSFCRQSGLVCALGTILIGTGVGVAVAQGVWQATKAPMRTQVSAPARAPFPVERCINVAGALEAPNEGDWGYKIRERDFKTIRAAGFDTIRVPIKFSAHAMEQAPYTLDPAFMAVSMRSSAGPFAMT